jgi:hypothetical protein
VSTFGLWAAIRTVKSRIGTWNGYEQFRELVPEVTRDEWAQAIGQARAALSNRVSELTRPLNRRPTPAEVTTYTTRNARGFMQQLDIFVRDRDTGLVEARPYTIRGTSLRSRSAIMAEALSRYQDAIDNNPDDYPEDILGAAYVGTYELVPG